MLRRRLACIVTLVVATTTLGLTMPAARAVPVGREPPGRAGLSSWRSCGDGVQCATLSVPVDHSAPGGEHVPLAVTRLRAEQSEERIGSLVFNFGGPGDAGSTTLPYFADQIPAEIRDRYDLVSFDPRGTGRSRPAECIDDATADRVNAVDPTPDTDEELRAMYDGTNQPVDLVARCIARNGAWLARLGSRNVARDMDQLRDALGDEQLSYVGFSYGTVIGAVYAQMFPERVGRMVLDAPVDLSTDAVAELRASADGFAGALDAFLADCAARRSCAFHSNGDLTTALAALGRRFENGLRLPARAASGDSDRKAGVATFYTALISALYDKEYGWAELADALAGARSGDGSLLLDLADLYNGREDDGTYDNIDEVIGIILCDDRDDPVPSFAEYRAEYERGLAEYPLLGSYVGSTVLGCDPRLPRPPASEQVGDVRVTGAAPILVVGTTGDPATPYAGARDLADRLTGSRLLTFDSTEHTAYTKNRCIDAAVDGYLLEGVLPAEGTVCRG